MFRLPWYCLFAGLLCTLSLTCFAKEELLRTYSNNYFSVELPKTMTLRNEVTTPTAFTKVKETVMVLANYGAKDRKAAVSGVLDPQVRSIISLRKGNFDVKNGPAVDIALTVDSIKERRGLPVDVKERMNTFHHVKQEQINGIPFSTYQLKIASSPVIYTFYSGVIKDRLVSLIWTAYSKDPATLNYYSGLALTAIKSFKLNGYQ